MRIRRQLSQNNDNLPNNNMWWWYGRGRANGMNMDKVRWAGTFEFLSTRFVAKPEVGGSNVFLAIFD